MGTEASLGTDISFEGECSASMPLNPNPCQANLGFLRAPLCPPRLRLLTSARVELYSSRSRNLKVELVKNARCHVQNFLIHLAIGGDRVQQRNRNNLVSLKRRHLAKFRAMHHIDRAQSIARRQHPVISRRRSTALNVAEDYRARFEAGALFDFGGQGRTDSTQPNVPEFIASALQSDRSTVLLISVRKLCAFGRDYDTEIPSASVALANQLRDLVDIEGNFGGQNYVSAARDSAIACDPSRIASHHFHHDHAIMRLGGRMYA